MTVNLIVSNDLNRGKSSWLRKEYLHFSPKSESIKFYHFLVEGIHFDHIAVDFEMQNLHDVIFDGN